MVNLMLLLVVSSWRWLVSIARPLASTLCPINEAGISTMGNMPTESVMVDEIDNKLPLVVVLQNRILRQLLGSSKGFDDQ